MGVAAEPRWQRVEPADRRHISSSRLGAILKEDVMQGLLPILGVQSTGVVRVAKVGTISDGS
jgi:hypothetical protein